MPRRSAVPEPSRAEQVAALMDQLRPQVEAAVRALVERAVDVPEAEEFGTIEHDFRTAGLDLANTVRQASLASRKKRGTSAAASSAPTASTPPNSTPTSNASC